MSDTACRETFTVQESSETVELRRTMRREVVWTVWTAWSECSLTCGRGVRSRYRDCVAADDEVQRGLVTGARQCDGRASDFIVCTENVTTLAVRVIILSIVHSLNILCLINQLQIVS